MIRTLFLALLLFIASVAGQARAEPATSAWVESESGRLRLVSASLGAAPSLRLGLEFQLAPEWKIYWRNPGDAGYPPRLDWSGTANAEGFRILWPAPHRFELAGLQNHGYKGAVILPVDATVPDPAKPVQLRTVVEFLACAQICVPQKAELALDLPAALADPSPFAHDIGRFAAMVPGDGRRHGLTVTEAVTWGQGDGARLAVTLAAQTPLGQPDLFVEAEEVASFGAPSVTLSEGGRQAVLEVPVVPGTVLKPMAGERLRVTLTDGARAVETEVIPRAGTAPAPPAGTGDGLAAMLLVALLGGLILNLMPCVLPVLSIKLLGILGHGGAERAHARASFLASASGIITSFLALAGLALAVKAAGMAVGWGIQFQQPVFLVAMILLLLAFSANLLGLFEIRLPAFLMNGGGTGVPHHSVLGHFLSGAFATLLATPCSAPFLGTAIGFALARGPVEIVAIFSALGLGMASPFLVVAVWPDAALRLPRPGPWMVRVRQGMGVALAGTALWLGTVLAALGGGGETERGAVAWVRFDQAALERLVSEGKMVFVDVTADWCITCKVNKAAVVERGAVAARLAAPDVVAMKADWTRPDESISRYLASFGRYGIPFNAVYGPRAPAGIALAELLSEADVLAALDRAGSK